ncbi:MAG: serine hydrolase domain-containing protein [Planctomycetota bacterium]|nr:serine hydrolase domain-containing protein [Planctomycetota bacterium]
MCSFSRREPIDPSHDQNSVRRRLLATGIVSLAGLGWATIRAGRVAAQQPTVPKSPPVLTTGQASAAGLSAPRLQQIADRLQAETDSGRVSAASILVARHGKTVLHRGFGRLDSSPDAPLTQPDTIYLLASISKPVTVCGLMRLVEHGQVQLSDPVQDYLPEFQGDRKAEVKVWHLLSHTSGLPDMLPDNVALRKAHAPLGQFVKRALRTPLLYQPGTQFAYQSMGTLLAAEITERISGMRLREFLQREIFLPLKMQHTVLGLDNLKIPDTAIYQESNPGTPDSQSWGPNSPYWRDMGHPWGGLHSSTGDLARLLQTFLNGGRYGKYQLFSPATTAAMTRDHNRAIGAPWGLGWALRDSPVWNYFGDLGSATTFGHVGVTGTVAWADPARQLLCVLLTTGGVSKPGRSLLNGVSNMVQSAVVSA